MSRSSYPIKQKATDRLRWAEADGKLSAVIVRDGKEVISINMTDGIVSIHDDGSRLKTNQNTINYALEYMGMSHRIRNTRGEWWLECTKSRSFRFFSGIKVGMSARHWINAYKGLRNIHNGTHYALANILSD